MAKTRNETVSKSKTRKKSTAVYPKFSLIEALRIAETIRDNNASDPYDRLLLAKALDTTPESSSFRQMITASRKFGLTEGGYQAPKISVTDLGKNIISPTTDEEKTRGLLTALFRVKFYETFFKKFNKSKIPREDLLLNTLEREYRIPKDDLKQCYSLLMKNARELNLITDIQGSLYINLDNLSQPTEDEQVTPFPEEPTGTLRKLKDEKVSPETEKVVLPPEVAPPTPTLPEEAIRAIKPIVFISHSKNQTILKQIKSLLEFGSFKYKVATETETSAIPIPDKIFGIMRDCNCAIINISADEQERQPDGSFRINPNVLIEIGAAYLTYNQRIILLIDKRLTLPSNLQGIAECRYEGDELTAEAVFKLQKNLTVFRNPVD